MSHFGNQFQLQSRVHRTYSAVQKGSKCVGILDRTITAGQIDTSPVFLLKFLPLHISPTNLLKIEMSCTSRFKMQSCSGAKNGLCILPTQSMHYLIICIKFDPPLNIGTLYDDPFKFSPSFLWSRCHNQKDQVMSFFSKALQGPSEGPRRHHGSWSFSSKKTTVTLRSPILLAKPKQPKTLHI